MSKKIKIPLAYKPAIITTLREGYGKQQLLKDAVAGINISIVALPLAIAFAISAGVSPAQGLITAVVGGFVAALFGGSRYQVSGPIGALAVTIYGVLHKYGLEGLAVATIMSGLMLVIMGLVRFGGVLQFIPFTVVVGFTSGIGVIIGTGQIPAFLGMTLENDPAAWVDKIFVYASNLHHTSLWTIFVGMVSLYFAMFWNVLAARLSFKHAHRIPSSLMAIVVGTILVKIFDLPVLTIGDKFDSLSASFVPKLPGFSLTLIRDVFQASITMAFLGGIVSLLSAAMADGMTGHKHRPNMELIAQGISNICTPLFGGIPSTGAVARTATNIRSGGKTPIAAMVHALILLLIMLFVGQWTALIPLTTLAAVLFVVSYNMVDWRTFVKFFKAPKSDIMVLLTTFFLTIIVDLSVAIQVGVVMAAMLFINRMAEVSKVDIMSTIDDHDDAPYDPMGIAERTIPDGVVVYEIYGQFFFGAVEKFKSILSQFEKPTQVLIIRMRSVLTIDSSGLFFLEDLLKRCEKENVRLILSGVHTQPTLTLAKAGMIERIGEKNFAAHIDQALELAEQHIAARQEAPAEHETLQI